VDESGTPSSLADDFLARCGELAEYEGLDPGNFNPECTRNLVEVSTPPATSVEDLTRSYLSNLRTALRAGRDLDLRLYPLATYPLPLVPDMRDELHYRLQARTLGRERFLHAGRCAGVHLHVEVPPGTVDPRAGVAYDTTPEDRAGLLATYNLATALDPAIVALTRSCPFYEGRLLEMTARTACYRGSPDLAPYGLYAGLGAVGGLRPYAADAEDLVVLQFDRYHAWLSAMERAGVEPELFTEAGNGLLDAAWNPVRLNVQGTVELRGIDGNYPAVVLDVAALVNAVTGRVRAEGLTVKPTPGIGTIEPDERFLRVPGFDHLSGRLFREAATAGAASPAVAAYLDSVFAFAGSVAEELDGLKSGAGYRCTESEMLESLEHGSRLSRSKGLELVLEACDELERQVEDLYQRGKAATAKAGADGD
jgi:carboxylate-amine ligase